MVVSNFDPKVLHHLKCSRYICNWSKVILIKIFFDEIDHEATAGHGIFRICQLIVNYVLNPKNQMIDTLNF